MSDPTVGIAAGVGDVERYGGPVRNVISLHQKIKAVVDSVIASRRLDRVLGRYNLPDGHRSRYLETVGRRFAVDRDAAKEGMGEGGYPFLSERLRRAKNKKKHQGY